LHQLEDPLNYGEKYYWRIRGENLAGFGEWSEIWSFLTDYALETPIVELPDSEKVDVPIPTRFEWNPVEDASDYDLQISTDEQFTSVLELNEQGEVQEDTTSAKVANQSSWKVSQVVEHLDFKTKYYWRVKALNDDGISDWSSVNKFTTEDSVPEVPTWQPENGDQNVSTTPLITWSESSRSDYFDLQLADNPEFNNPTVDLKELSTTEYQVSNELEDGITYHWRVRAGNSSGYSDWSAPLSFTTQLSTSIENTESPQAVSLQQNYPNPFNPSTIIQFGVPDAAFVELGVYNMLGQRVALLANEQRSQGWHEVTLDASNLSSGTYIYRLQIGGNVLTRKLMLIK